MAIGESNIHLYNLRINEEDEFFTQIVPVVGGEGQVSRTPIATTGEVSYGEVTETVTFDEKIFTITDSEYSGDVSIGYLAKKFFIVKVFALFLSGLTQVNTFIARIIVKVTGSAFAYSVKNSFAAVRVRSIMTAASSVVKNIAQPVSIKFSLVKFLFSKKNACAAITAFWSLTDVLSNRKNVDSTVMVKCGGSAAMNVAKYTVINDYVNMTLDEMKDSTLNELVYTEV